MRPFPTAKTWSKQHYKIRTPRQLVDSFDLGALHSQKQWWRERRLAPVSELGFPDYRHTSNFGISRYIEQMDKASLVLAVSQAKPERICATVVSEWSFRAQQLSQTLSALEVSVLIRSFKYLRHCDIFLYSSLMGRILRLKASMSLLDCAVCLVSIVDLPWHREIKGDLARRIVALLRDRDDHKPDGLLYSFVALVNVDRDEYTIPALCNILKQIRSSDLSDCDLKLVTTFATSCSKYFGKRGDSAACRALVDLLSVQQRWAHDETAIGLFATAAKACKLEFNISVPNLPVDSGCAADWLCLPDISDEDRFRLTLSAVGQLHSLTVTQGLELLNGVLGNGSLPEVSRVLFSNTICDWIANKFTRDEINQTICLEYLSRIDYDVHPNRDKLYGLWELTMLKFAKFAETPVEQLVRCLSPRNKLLAPINDPGKIVGYILKRDLSILTVDELIAALVAANAVVTNVGADIYSRAFVLLEHKLRFSDPHPSSLVSLMSLELPDGTFRFAIHALIFYFETSSINNERLDDFFELTARLDQFWTKRLRMLVAGELRKLVF